MPQAVIRMGGMGVPRKDPDFMAAYLVNHILGGGSFTSVTLVSPYSYGSLVDPWDAVTAE